MADENTSPSHPNTGASVYSEPPPEKKYSPAERRKRRRNLIILIAAVVVVVAELPHPAVREPDPLLETVHEVAQRFRRHPDEDVGRGLGADGIARERLDEVGDDLGNVDLSRERDRDRLRLDENRAERHR